MLFPTYNYHNLYCNFTNTVKTTFIALLFVLGIACALPVYAQNTYEIRNLGEQINSPFAELNPIITADGKKLYFIRSGYSADNSVKEGQDIWMSERNADGTWTKAARMSNALNKQQFNTVFYVSPAGDNMLIGGSYKDGVYWGPGFSFINQKNGDWGEPIELDIKKLDNMLNGFSSSVYLLPDNKTLLLSFSEEDDSKSNDLYISRLLKNGKWSQPVLCSGLNTKYDESTPFMAADGVTLYFSSNRPGGFGQNDIYLTRRLDDTWQNWSTPINLGPQINTEQWDGYYTIPASGNVAYMVSYKNSYGKADIVEITLSKQTKPQPVALISGKVIDAKTKKPVESQIVYEELPTGNEAGKTSFWSKSGDYKIILPYGKNYGISARASGYIPVSANVNLSASGEYVELERNLVLVPIETGQVILLNNIFFDEYSDVLKDISLPELNRLVKLLKDNPSMEIEISGHTDAVGTDAENQLLSDKRAASVKNYLIQKGIKASRLLSVGYGETQPVADNNNDVDRQLNRRVEFKILKK